MSQVSAASADNNGKPPPVLVNSTTDNLRNQTQIECLVTLVNSLGQFLVQSERAELMSPEYDDNALKARSDAAETFQSVNLQIRNVLDDQSRWNIRRENTEKDVADLLHTQIKESRARTREVEQRIEQSKGVRPSLLLKANVLQLANGNWIVWHGSNLQEASLYGVGSTPMQAMDDFDKIYHEGRAIPEVLKEEPPPPPNLEKVKLIKKNDKSKSSR